ncbi:FAD-dependent 5-carboxymethylaminomethyl-2-thiouridine(34) oxidoreductase MnmC [Paraherbaspirillum soli]|uniref:tRNA 5-methylaminomethyl-2-thiouridine biosynthesis bifunctional protein MnmC n=1 Tax=Paraherbaspirillum soli TaxID=631222 RepID=A0ABW0M2E8_9BURK
MSAPPLPPDAAVAASRHAWQQRSRFVVLDTAFDAGLHFFATWQAWRDDPQRPQQLHYLALSPLPLYDTSAQWHALAVELGAAWPPAVPGFHRIFLEQGRIVLTLMIGDSAACLRQLEASVDSFYLHGSALQQWPPPLLTRLGRLAATQAILSSAALVDTAQKALQQAGFVFENDSGKTPHARFSPRWQSVTAAAKTDQRSAIVIGAGLAGTAACQRLTMRGWQVSLIERHAQVAQEASGNAAGIFMPVLSKDDNPTSRLSRSAYLFALQLWRELGGIGNAISGATCGVLQVARDAEHAIAQQQLAQQAHTPAAYAQWLDQAAASTVAGTAVSAGSWHFPAGGWLHPHSLCQAMLRACGDRLQSHFGQHATALERIGDGWTVRDANGAEIASAPVVILANGCGALTLAEADGLPLTAIRGQVTYLDANVAPKIADEPAPVICGEAYLTPAYNGICSVGASYDEDGEQALRQTSQDENLTRLAHMLPDWPDAKTDMTTLPLAGRVGFRCVAADRLPLVGALPDQTAHCSKREPQLKDMPRLPGLYGLLAYASRGLIWAPLAAELLASQLNGEPLPIENELAAALDPARFLLKTRRRGGN